ncbi:DUF6221 family protein [Streptomyces sp. NPDC052000]|uniref:DUF6221 family protein n=1 Tax=Streptomyces sp. NPDC052000 TaxID=3155676 RepID=UPI00345061F5
MTDDLVQFIRDRLDDDERAARLAPGPSWERREIRSDDGTFVFEEYVAVADPDRNTVVLSDVDAEVLPFVLRHDPARVLADVEAKRELVKLHTPEWDIVEWPHDQTGKGRAQVCRSCANRDIDGWQNWRPAFGGADTLPEGVKPPYILAPCATLRLLSLPYADHPGYREEWRPVTG